MRVEQFGFDEMADALERADRDITPQVKQITSKTLLEMKKTAQKLVRGHPHLKGLGRSFNYDVDVGFANVTGEVGADLTRVQGPLDHLIENGTTRNAPIPHWRPAADKEVPLWIEHLEKAAAEAIDEG